MAKTVLGMLAHVDAGLTWHRWATPSLEKNCRPGLIIQKYP